MQRNIRKGRWLAAICRNADISSCFRHQGGLPAFPTVAQDETHVDDPMASIARLGGSTPNSRGVSPLWTQRHNFFSVVSTLPVKRTGLAIHLPPAMIIGSAVDRARAPVMLELRHVPFGGLLSYAMNASVVMARAKT